MDTCEKRWQRELGDENPNGMRNEARKGRIDPPGKEPKTGSNSIVGGTRIEMSCGQRPIKTMRLAVEMPVPEVIVRY